MPQKAYPNPNLPGFDPPRCCSAKRYERQQSPAAFSSLFFDRYDTEPTASKLKDVPKASGDIPKASGDTRGSSS
jgi:hypothetical protein